MKGRPSEVLQVRFISRTETGFFGRIALYVSNLRWHSEPDDFLSN